MALLVAAGLARGRVRHMVTRSQMLGNWMHDALGVRTAYKPKDRLRPDAPAAPTKAPDPRALTLKKCDAILQRAQDASKLRPLSEQQRLNLRIVYDTLPQLVRDNRSEWFYLPHIASRITRLMGIRLSRSAGKELLRVILAQVRDDLLGFDGKAIWTMMMAFTRGRVHDPVFYKRALAIALNGSIEVYPGALSEMVAASVMHRFRDAELLTAVAQLAIANIDKFTMFDLGNTAWAFASSGVANQDLFHAIAQQTIRANSFHGQNLSKLTWAFATIGFNDDSLFNAVSKYVVAGVDAFNFHNVASIAWAYGHLGIANHSVFNALAGRTITLIDKFPPQHLADIACAFAKVGIKHDNLFKWICTNAIVGIERFEAKPLAELAWAFGTLRVRDDELCTEISQQALKMFDEFKCGLHLANLIWLFAGLGVHDSELFAAVQQRSLERTQTFTGDALAILAKSFAVLSIQNGDLFAAVADRTVSIITTLKPVELADIAWAFATLQIVNHDLFAAIAQRCVQHVNSLDAGDLSRIAWACAVAKVDNDDLFHVIGERAHGLLSSMTFRDAAYLIWAFASRRMSDSDVLAPLTEQAQMLLHESAMGGIADILWAQATLEVVDRDIFESFGSHAKSIMDSGSVNDLSRLAWAFAKAGLQDSTLFNAIARYAIGHIRQKGIAPQAAADMAWAFATTGNNDVTLFHELSKHIDEFDAASVANMAWALAANDMTANEAVALAILNRALQVNDQFSAEGRRQLHQWRLAVGAPDVDRLAERLPHDHDPDAVFRSWSGAMHAGVDRSPNPVADEIAAMLNPNFCSFVRVLPCPDTGLSLDIAVPDHRVAIEVISPACCIWNVASQQHAWNGNLRLRGRVLTRHGWTVVNISAGDFQAAPDKQRFLRSRLPDNIMA